MTGFLIVLLIGLAITVLLVIIASKSYNWDGIAILLAVICGIIIFTGACVFGACSFKYKAAEVIASLINREYNTTYTQAEVFYASDVINTIRELDRTRIEINGNIGK
jgi:cytochrome bd-type quinol oxidase subunit 2